MLYNVAFCWLYLNNTLTTHCPMNVKLKQYFSEAVCVSVIRRVAPNLLDSFDHAIVSCWVTKQLGLRSLTS